MILCCFRSSECEPVYKQNFDRTNYVAVYAAKTYSIIVCLLGTLQPLCFKPFSKFLNYNQNRNTCEYTALFKVIIDIMETY